MVIYKTINLINGKIYIGQDSKNDPSYFGSGLILGKSIEKYGIKNFKKEIIEVCKTKQELNIREVFWIDKFKSTDKSIGYNISKGGSGGDTFSNQSDETKSVIINKRMSKLKNIQSSNDYKMKISNSSKKMWSDPIHKENMSNIMKGRTITWSDKIGKSRREYCKNNKTVISEETKIKNGNAHRGIPDKSIDESVEFQIINLYKEFGPKTISKTLKKDGIFVSTYLIIRTLKKYGIYQKWKKGIGKNVDIIC